MLKITELLQKRLWQKENPVPKNPIKQQPDIAGVLDGKRAFIGPESVVIDLTNRCNERCIGCWLYSPLLKEKPNSEWLNQEISFDKARALISSLAEVGVKRIRFTGGGEPFMYPKIMELIGYTKTKGIICGITTNFSLFNKGMVKDLISLEVDELAISLWASSKEAYKKTHPNAPSNSFEKIKENLMTLTTEKKNRQIVTLCNVICNLNCSELEEMFRFALEMKVDGVYFTLVDTLDGTEILLLDKEQRREALRQAEKIQKIWQSLDEEKRIKLDYFEGFVSRLQEQGSLVGNYDRERVNRIPCYVGWIFARILADGCVVPCCRGGRKPMGNINSQDFKDIWFSQRYNEFRMKAKYLTKTDSYFSDIGCLKMCDNLMHNEEINRRIIDMRIQY